MHNARGQISLPASEWWERSGLRLRVRPRVGNAGAAVLGDLALVAAGDVVEHRDVVVGDPEGLLHHHRRGQALTTTADVLVAQGVPDLVVDGVLPVAGHVGVERL